MARKKKLSPNSFTPEEVAKLSSAGAAINTPTKALDALMPGADSIAGIELLPITLDLPVQLHIAKSAYSIGGPITPVDVVVALYLMTTPFEESDKVLRDPDKLLAAARKKAREVPPHLFYALGGIIEKRLQQAFSTAIATAREDDESQKKIPSDGSSST